ncbi:uncharacterized protein LOC128397162 [Panonychus citri]|uniref:uncharacterized protein LOC128397162 n=1 Tax=Panonychus citri TaxID=50023 RepID=UPI002307643E|nr:uncharacterized protein LOC128397162 [Panonychus citri]
MGSFDLTRDRIRPINTLEPLIHQETELLTFSPIIGQPQRSPLIKKNLRRYKKHSQFQRRSGTFLTLKYGFVVFVIASSVATLCDIDNLTTDLFSELQTNQTQGSNNLTLDSNMTIYSPIINKPTISPITNLTQPLIEPVNQMVPIILLPGNMSVSTSYRDYVHHKMKVPLYVYMAVSIGVLFMAIFGRTMEIFFIPFGFGIFMLIEIGIMFGLCFKETEFGLGYSSQLWIIYILHVIFSFSYSLIILIMHQHL